MPGDVAVERPDARIVGVDLHDEVTVGREQLRIPARRILRVDDRTVPGDETCARGR